MQATSLLKQRLSFWEAHAAANLLPDVPQEQHAGGESLSSDIGSGGSLDVEKWAAALWELAGSGRASEQEITGELTTDAWVSPVRPDTVQEASSRHAILARVDSAANMQLDMKPIPIAMPCREWFLILSAVHQHGHVSCCTCMRSPPMSFARMS